MAPTIRIDDEVFDKLKEQAEPFVDSPNDVLRRILGMSGQSNGRRDRDGQRRIPEVLQEIIAEDAELELLEEANNTYMHFAPSAWKLPSLSKSSTKSGLILSFMFVNRSTNLKVNLEIQPGASDIRRRIYDSARGQPWFTGRKQLSREYCRIYRMNFIGPREFEKHRDDIGWIEKRIRERMAEFKSTDFPRLDDFVRGLAL